MKSFFLSVFYFAKVLSNRLKLSSSILLCLMTVSPLEKTGMARILDEQVEQLKQTYRCAVGGVGHAPKRQGKGWLMACPFHDDKTPSLIISPDIEIMKAVSDS